MTGNNTGLNWDDAKSWAAGLTVGTFSGWSLPAADETCSGVNGFNCTNSQMGELYYTALSNLTFGPLSNTGPLKNLQPFPYWSGTELPQPGNAWFFNFYNGSQSVEFKTDSTF